mmetsp:Transcript_8471/g.31010  ORF Transcript_8471/g.31010 Transcript_8471/m.31010 type:complete len:785 (-) Transcript_8471:149-2503(-)
MRCPPPNQSPASATSTLTSAIAFDASTTASGFTAKSITNPSVSVSFHGARFRRASLAVAAALSTRSFATDPHRISVATTKPSSSRTRALTTPPCACASAGRCTCDRATSSFASLAPVAGFRRRSVILPSVVASIVAAPARRLTTSCAAAPDIPRFFRTPIVFAFGAWRCSASRSFGYSGVSCGGGSASSRSFSIAATTVLLSEAVRLGASVTALERASTPPRVDAPPPDDAPERWTEREIRDYFASGGKTSPAPKVDDDDDDDEMDAASKEAKRARVLRRRRGCLLPHVPAYHLETLIDSFHALRRGDPPFSPTSPALDGLAPGMHGIIRLLVKHFADTRVVNPDIRDAMLQSVSVLLQYKEFVAVFEQNDAARDMMVPSLLACFDARFWIPVSNILLRLCKGVGFGQEGGGRDAIGDDDDIGTFVAVNAAVDAPAEGDAALARVMTSPHPDSASPLFQRLLILHCRADRELLAEFLDRLFNTLNWTITEFSVACKELLEDQRSNLLTPEGRQHQRKCTVMFELSVTLERVLEFISLDLPSAFLDSSSLDLRRLRESLLFVLGHATTGPDAANFEEILTKNLAPPDKVSRAAILAPIAGILLNLDAAAEKRAASASQGASCEPRSGYKSSIVTELARNIHSRDVSQLEYLRDFEWPSSFETPTSKLAALRAFVEKVREGKDEVARVHEIEDAAQVPEEFVDPIMQTTMTDPVTLPGSGVVVDRETIKRHLLCDGSDPFSRSPLDESMLVDAVELRERIEKWREETHTPMKEKAEAEEEADGTFD